MSTPERRLLLLRHAKSDYPSGVADHERPLAPRGIREAALAGDWIRANAPEVDAVLCSTATRTRETLARTGLDVDDVHFDDDLYDTTPSTVLRLVNGIAEDVATLLVVGHEPTMSALAIALSEPDDSEAFQDLTTKFPTSAIALLNPLVPWDRLGMHQAQLVDFHVPR